jgi:hypothetical protein
MSKDPGIVYRDRDGYYFIGPLTEDQYRVVSDSLELAAAWVKRDVDVRTAIALKRLIPNPAEVVYYNSQINEPAKLFEQMPDPPDK